MENKSEKINAYLRIRPFLSNEDKNQQISFENQTDTQIIDKIAQNKGKNYNFNKIFDQNSNNQQIYEDILQNQVRKCIKGFNSTIFAYGQTASGKTHTIFGHKDQEHGIIYMALDQIFQKKQKKRKMVILISYIEIYNEQVSDLIASKSKLGENLKVIEKFGNFYVQGCKEIIVNNIQEAINILNEGNNNKTFGYSHLNNKSSRSHTIFKIIIGTQDKNTGEKSVSELNFVDLAGSESLSDDFGYQQQQETKSINLSLFNLKSVISSLSNNDKFIPYRQSILTKLLQNSLGGNSLTSVICTIAPGEQHYNMSKRTIQFGQIAKKIENKLHQNIVFISNKSQKIVYKEKPILKEIKISEKNLLNKKTTKNISDFDPKKDIQSFQIQDPTLNFLKEGIEINTAGNPNNPIALMLHSIGGGNYAGLDCMPYLYGPLSEMGYYVVAPDFPGHGKSKGEKFSSRITENSEKLINFIDQVLMVLQKGNQKSILLGYDYGASAALHYGASKLSQGKISQMFIFHPSWNNNSPMEILQNIKIKTNLLWVETDQFHSIKIGEKMNKIIPNSKLIKLNCGKFNSEKSKGNYKCISPQIIEQIDNYIDKSILQIQENPNLNQLLTNQTKNEINNEERKNNDSDSDDLVSLGTESDNISLLEVLQNRTNPESENFMKFGSACVRGKQTEKINQDNMQQLIQKYSKIPQNPDVKLTKKQMQFWAVQRFKEIIITGELQDYYNAYLQSTPLKPKAIQIFGNLPAITPYMQKSQFIDLGIWKNNQNNEIIKNYDQMKNSPDYCKNRQVLVKANIQANKFKQGYMLYDGKSKDYILTHKGYIEDYNQENGTFLVKIQNYNDLNNEKIIEVNKKDIFKYNSSTNFKNTSSQKQNQELLFEDGVKCKYSEFITKAKILESALSISDLVSQIDYSLDQQQNTHQVAKQCVKNILSVVDLIHLVHEGIDPSRYCVTECGKLAYYGQGTCHILASVTCAFLLPFADILNLDVKFRAGSLTKKNRDVDENGQPLQKWDCKPRYNNEDHTWCEITYKSVMQTYVIDTSFQYYNLPIDIAYSGYGRYHVSEKIQCNSLLPNEPQICFDNKYISSIQNHLTQEQELNEKYIQSIIQEENLQESNWENLLKDQIIY